MDKLDIEVTTGSRLRSLGFQVKSAASILKPGWTVPDALPALLNKAGEDLQKLSVELEAYFKELLSERQNRRFASFKASLKKSMRPPKRRR